MAANGRSPGGFGLSSRSGRRQEKEAAASNGSETIPRRNLMSPTRRVLSAALVALLLAGTAQAALAARPSGGRSLKPFNYISLKKRLSKPVFPQTVREVFNLEMADEETIYVEVVRPDPEAYGERQLPVILEASPYHGTLADREGTRILPDPVDEESNLNWAGGSQLVHLELTFKNGEGEAGAGSGGTGSEGTALLVSSRSFGGLLQP
jgi:hypothetical protein